MDETCEKLGVANMQDDGHGGGPPSGPPAGGPPMGGPPQGVAPF